MEENAYDEEHKLEFEKMASNLDAQAALAFAQHRSALLCCPPAKMSHIVTVGDLAAKYAAVFYDSIDPIQTRYCSRSCEVGGYLHETMMQGCAYEEILEIADENVARLVSAVTPDTRLSLPRRCELYANQLGLAPVDSQIIKLADLRHEARAQFALVDLQPGLVRDWLQESSAALSSLHKLQNSALKNRIISIKADIALLESKTRNFRRSTK